MAIKWDQTINSGDLIVMEGVTYDVKQADPNYLPDNVVTIIRLSRQIPTADDD